MDGRWVASILVAGLLWLAAAVDGDTAEPLPLVRVEAERSAQQPMVLMLTGDGDWAPFPRAFAAAAAQAGSPVLGLKARAYLKDHRGGPAELAADLEAPVRAQLAAWRRRDLIVVGYSRGADWAAFVVNRWPEDLRSRVRAVVFVGLSEEAGFEFHFGDLYRDVARPTDLPTRPEVARLVGLPMFCVYGFDERNTFCSDPVPCMQVLTHAGGHRAKDDPELIATLLDELGLGSDPRARARAETRTKVHEPSTQSERGK